MASKDEFDQTTPLKQTGTDRDADGGNQDQILSQYQLIISEIESSDGHVGTSLRGVYEEDGDESWQTFMDKLDARIKQHDKEIEHMCNYHYQGFIDSVRSLLQVRTDVDKIKDEIRQTNNGLQLSGAQMHEKGKSLVKDRNTQEHIELAIEALTMCLPVLESYGKLREQMRTKRYYPALKTLEQLEHTYLPRVIHYRFAHPMCQTIPQLRNNIKDASKADLKDFLESVRRHSEKIGEVAMKNAAEQHNVDISLAIRRASPKKRPAPPPPNPFTGDQDKQKKKKAPPPPNPFTGQADPDELAETTSAKEEVTGSREQLNIDVEEGFSVQDVIDFAPVYRCLHIHTVLGDKDSFGDEYRKERRKQAFLALQPPSSMQETLEGYKKYFHEIIGFFVVEDHILNTTKGLINRAYMDKLWENAMSKLLAVLNVHTGSCTDADLMLQIKALIMLFCQSLKGYGLTTSQLYDVLLVVRDQYSGVLMNKWVEVFNRIFAEDNYTPITVGTQEEYQKITSIYPFRDALLESKPFPKSFPFSHFVPNVYLQVKEYIYACLKFSEDLHLSQAELDEMIRKLANMLLTRTLAGCLSQLIRTPHFAMPQLIQISVNMNYLEQSCSYLEEFISNITNAECENYMSSKLQGTSMFKDSRSEAEEQIYKQINVKIDEFFELASYDWQRDLSATEPSDYINDLIGFLRSNFQSFTNLPPNVAQTACMSACQHIAKALLDILKDDEIKYITIAALDQFSKDVRKCEEFAGSRPVQGMNDGTLQLAFDELRGILDVFVKWDWTTYVAEFGREYSRYLRVRPELCILLLEKLRESEKKKNNLLTNLRNKERDKKKLVDTLLNQLRQLSRTTAH